MVWLTSIAVMAGIILVISLYVNITSAIECRQNEARTAAVLEKLQNAIDEKRQVLVTNRNITIMRT